MILSTKSPAAASQPVAPPVKRLLWAALGVFFVYSWFGLIDQRVDLGAKEKERKRVRETAAALRDERRELELEYLTLTSYERLSEYAASAQLVSPRAEDGNMLYLHPAGTAAGAKVKQ